MRQGPAVAIWRLHPEFATRLVLAIREARESGLPLAGIFSAYRPPAFGIGGFSDKFNSLHTYGLAVDMHGIGGPDTPEAKLWHEIAARHGIVCPYGVHNRTEWNHCQATRVKMVSPENPLREQVTADGPLSLEGMFEAGSALIEDVESVAASFVSDPESPVISRQENSGVHHVRNESTVAEVMRSPNPHAGKSGRLAIGMANARGKMRSGKALSMVLARVPSIMADENSGGRAHWRSRHAAPRRGRSSTYSGLDQARRRAPAQPAHA
jgi:hypothetical protein